jgi:hypothetical protein
MTSFAKAGGVISAIDTFRKPEWESERSGSAQR